MRVLVVDDSPVACTLLCAILESAGIETRVAASGEQALETLRSYTPDIVTMDVNMPGMDGYATTARILQSHALPVVVLTATANAADAAIRALEAGALTVLQKPAGPEAPEFDRHVDELLRTLRVMSQVKVVRRSSLQAGRKSPAATKRLSPEPTDIPRIVGIAASAGGPAALKTLLQRLNPEQPWPIILVQHISAGFIGSFRDWLERIAPIPVNIAKADQSLERGVLYLAPDDRLLSVTSTGHVRLEPCRSEQLICPSADHLFHSMAKLGQSAIGIQLSGMGRDGAAGLLNLKNHGALTLTQEPSDAVIDSMPRTAIDMQAACEVLPAEQIAEMLNKLARQYLNENRPRQGC
ncbi:chemotaxis protein CheB [Stutzerimonas nitrititolerans]|uniref:chemotaxis protein CheB n=1 Tax=Stutzerimonas nitrititolerans TaxID=2482751 RepID=UPI0028B15336|nr:chemotaxis protein CheB [Stutzerimonas nitrititolerans]